MTSAELRTGPDHQVERPHPDRPDDSPSRTASLEPQAPGTDQLTLGEAGGLIAVTALAAVGTVSLVLAQLGRHDGLLALLGGLLLTTGLVGGATRLGGALPRLRVDPAELGLLAVVLLASLWFFLPGFPYASVDKDPGAYVAHAFLISRDGHIDVEDPVLAAGVTPEYDLAGRFPGLWTSDEDPTTVTSQFFPYYSSLLATADDLAGPRAVFNLNPVLAALSVALFTLAARRALGTGTAAVTAALLVTSMMQVWQAKYPSTEVTAQLLLAGAMLGAVLATSRRSAGPASTAAALVSGVCLGTGFLVRPDGFLYVAMAAAAASAVIAASRADRRLVALAAGVGLTLPYAFYNAYATRDHYSAANGVPRPALLLAVLGLLVGAGFLAREVLSRIAERRPQLTEAAARQARRWQRPAGALAVVLVGVLLLALYHRETLLGWDYEINSFSDGEVVRAYNERNMIWLSWYTTRLGLVVTWIGLGVLALQRWQAPRFILALPGLALLPLYAFDARVSMRLMWWVRRFVPAVLPALVLLMAVAIAWAIGNRLRSSGARWGLRLAGAAVLVFLLSRFTSQSLPLRSHSEMAGSWDMAAAVAETAGDDDGIFLYPRHEHGLFDPIRNTPGAVWWIFDQTTARLPEGYDISTIDAYRAAFPDQPVYLVTDTDTLPDDLPADRFELANQVVGELTVWEEMLHRRPTDPVTISQGMSIWRLVAR